MNDSVAGVAPARALVPIRLATIAGLLVLGLLGAFLVNWWVGAAVMALGLVMITRPLDLFVSVLLVGSAAAFAAHGNRSIQRDLSVVLVLTLYAGASFLAAWGRRLWALPESRFTAALLALALTTGIATLHGLAVRNPFRFLCLEVFPLFSLSFALAVGGLHLKPADLRIAGWTLAGVGVAASSIGFHYFAVTGMRTGGLPFTPIPGFIALVVLSLTLFDPAPRPRLVPVILFCVLICHQIVTFTRGFWLGLLVGIPLICALYGRHGTGARQRWSKVLRTLGFAALLMFLAAVIASSRPPWSEMVGLLGNRFASSFETKSTPETVSNVVRLVETRTALQVILSSPWFGYGHGSTLVVRQFFHPQTGPQWYVHEGYIMMWLKQGIFGLTALLWVLLAAFRLGLKGASHPDSHVAGWCVASAACTVFAAIIGLTNYFFFVVSQSFLLAFLWGVSLAASEPRHRWLVWRVPRSDPDHPVSQLR